MLERQLFSSLNAKTSGLIAITAVSAYVFIRKIKEINEFKKIQNDRKHRLIVITGCDTGLGYSMAVWAAKLGYKVLAGCLNENGEGAQKLRRQFPELVTVVSLNVTEPSSLDNFHSVCKHILEANGGKLRLWALIANAAVCTMGEFFWQTQRQKEQQMNVNFWGTINFVSGFRMLLLETKARVIVISSDCAQYPLPFLSVYCASKAALDTWTQSFRLEVAKYGVQVVAYHPRDFSTSSGLFGNIEQNYHQMTAEMGDCEREFYGDYLDKFMKVKQDVFANAKKKAVKPLSSPHRNLFFHLLESNIKDTAVLRDSDIIGKIFHLLCTALPQRYADKLINVLLNPDFKSVYWQEKNNRDK